MGKTSEKNAPIFVRGRGRGHLPPPPKKNVLCLQISLYTMIFVLKGKKQVKKCTHICKGGGHRIPGPQKCWMFTKSLWHCDFCCKWDKTSEQNAPIFVRGRGGGETSKKKSPMSPLILGGGSGEVIAPPPQKKLLNFWKESLTMTLWIFVKRNNK